MSQRVVPPQLNYDDILPLAIESRSNRREFLPVNGAVFGNTSGATVCRIDVNADSMLDASHSYLECDITNTSAVADTYLAVNPWTPSWIQRLRIESGGVVIEDINEYSRLYALLALNQTPQSYIKNNMANQGLYKPCLGGALATVGGGVSTTQIPEGITYSRQSDATAAGALPTADAQAWNLSTSVPTELHYPMTAECVLRGGSSDLTAGANVSSAQGGDVTATFPTAIGLAEIQTKNKIVTGASDRMCFPLVSGFLNMDQYIPLIMMNAGFTIELTLCSANRMGLSMVEGVGALAAPVDATWDVSNVKYVAHLIDLDRSFYDQLRSVMESSTGVLQLAGQTYRHFVGQMPVGTGPHTLTLPARVKSVKSIFGTFMDNTQFGSNANFDTSVFQNANLTNYRFEIGSVRYPQTQVQCSATSRQGVENQVELQKAWGKLGDYQHEQAYSWKNTLNAESVRDGLNPSTSLCSAFCIGYDFEAFQRVALEAGINTQDRSLPINFIAERSAVTTNPTRADFYVLCDALYYINLDGTVSVSI